MAHKVHDDLLDHKNRAAELTAELDGMELEGDAAAMLDETKTFHAAFNFLDTSRFAEAAKAG